MTSSFYASVFLSFCLLITAFIYVVSNKLIRKNVGHWYIKYLAFILVIEVITYFSIYILECKSTQYIYPLYVAGEFFILTRLFLAELKADKKWRIITGCISFYIFIEATSLWYINYGACNGSGKIVSHLIIICLAGLLLIKKLKDLETNNTLSIIYASLFFYYGASLFLFLLINQLTEENILVWITNNILSSILYGSSIYTFHKIKKWKLTSNM